MILNSSEAIEYLQRSLWALKLVDLADTEQHIQQFNDIVAQLRENNVELQVGLTIIFDSGSYKSPKKLVLRILKIGLNFVLVLQNLQQRNRIIQGWKKLQLIACTF
jgi:hypothetical protein